MATTSPRKKLERLQNTRSLYKNSIRSCFLERERERTELSFRERENIGIWKEEVPFFLLLENLRDKMRFYFGRKGFINDGG